ncbi:MAG TPA: ABC transporter substrate-binding protein [Vicinamibacteria bacterium]|nr:ABC transporter substrate-binding protein [Vicinamibacteria bacterium]
MSALVLAALLAVPADTLVVGTLADPVSLDPHRATDLVAAAVLSNVCEPLVRYRADGSRPEGVLATAWATVDARSWTFTLRTGVKFHDGAAFDAAAVVANLENLRQERSFTARAQASGPAVVSVMLDRPNAALLATLSQPFFCMQSPRELRSRKAGPLSGTGPFRLGAVRRGQVELLAAREHWAGKPRLQRVVFRRLPSEDALLAALLADEVDVTSALGLHRVEALRRHAGLTLDARTGLNIAFLSVNNERKPLADPVVRHAISAAIDRPAIVRDLLGGHGEPARNPLPPSVWGFSARTRELSRDRAAARRMLARAGLPKGFETTLLTVDAPRPYLPAPLPLAARIRDDLAQVGIRARLRQVKTWSEYLARAGRGDYDLALLGWQADTVDPNDFLSVLLGSEYVGTTNRSRYRSPAMDALLEQGRRGRDQKERAVRYREAQTLFQRDMPWVPLYHVSVFTAYRRNLRGLMVGPTGIPRYHKAWKH